MAATHRQEKIRKQKQELVDEIIEQLKQVKPACSKVPKSIVDAPLTTTLAWRAIAEKAYQKADSYISLKNKSLTQLQKIYGDVHQTVKVLTGEIPPPEMR